VAQAWRVHIDGKGPTAIVLSRQAVPVLDGTAERAAAGVPAGAYTLVDENPGALDLVLIGTGSEVSVCVGARELLESRGLSVRVVSMPCWELFAEQPEDRRHGVLPPRAPRLAVEAGTSLGWERYADESVSIDRFGASAPGKVVLTELGFTPENVAARALALLAAKEGT
jgi:transketolase